MQSPSISPSNDPTSFLDEMDSIEEVVAMTGRPEEAEFLTDLGAAEVIGRDGYSEQGRPLAKERWAAAVDVVGGHVLANVCASLKYRGAVAASPPRSRHLRPRWHLRSSRQRRRPRQRPERPGR